MRRLRSGLGTNIALVGVGALLAVIAVLPPMAQVFDPDDAAASTVPSTRAGGVAPASAMRLTPDALPLDPAGFAANACVAFAPLAGDVHRTVFLDAGHGGPDPGALGTTTAGATIDEKQLTLPVVLDATQLLRRAGYRVVLSRTVDTAVARLGPADVDANGETASGKHADTIARAHCANLAKAIALVSVHFDAFTDQSVRGATTVYDTSRPFSAQNQHLATLLQSDILAALTAQGSSVPDRGAIPDAGQGGPGLSEAAANYGHLALLGPPAPGYIDEPSAMPGALVEPLFITAAEEGSLAASAPGQQAIAHGVAQAIETFTSSP